MRVTGAADPAVPVDETLPGKLPQRKLVTTAAAGYSSYGNQIGLATGQVNELYHPGYAAKRMEIGAVVGATPADHVRRETPAPGDVVVLLGGRTGRDGIGGATGSSKAHSRGILGKLRRRGAEGQRAGGAQDPAPVPPRATPASMIKRCNDFGAGGVSRGHRRAGRRPVHRPERRAARSTTGSTAPSWPSPSRRSAWPWRWRPEDVDAFIALRATRKIWRPRRWP